MGLPLSSTQSFDHRWRSDFLNFKVSQTCTNEPSTYIKPKVVETLRQDEEKDSWRTLLGQSGTAALERGLSRFSLDSLSNQGKHLLKTFFSISHTS